MNLNKILQKLSETFGGKKVTITTIEEEGAPKKIVGTVMGCWIDVDRTCVHFAVQGLGNPFLTDVSVLVTLKNDAAWCHLSYEFGKPMGDAVRVPQIAGVESFVETFRSCFA